MKKIIHNTPFSPNFETRIKTPGYTVYIHQSDSHDNQNNKKLLKV